MRREETIARIFLICSVANIALAAPAVVRLRQLDVAKAASGKRQSSDKATDVSPGYKSIQEWVSDSQTEPYFSAPGSPLGSSHQSTSSDKGLIFTTPHGSALASPELPSGSSHQGHEGPESSQKLPEWPFEHASDADSTTSHGSALWLDPPKSTFFNDAMKKKLMIYGGLASLAGVSAGGIYEVQKTIRDTSSSSSEE